MADTLGGAWMPHTLTPAELEEHEERWAILQFEAGVEEFVADFEARRICKERWAKLKAKA